MQQSGFLYELRPSDYILGSTSPLKGEDLIPSADWIAHRPEDEKQFDINFDTLSCSTFSGTNDLETLFNFFLSQSIFSEAQIKWATDNGYLVNGKFNFSDRFSAISNGTKPNGQYVQNVWDDFRNTGLIPEKDLPFGGTNQAEYLDKSLITPAMKAKAQKFLEVFIEKDEKGKYKINYEWVPITNTSIELAAALKQAPLQVAVTKEYPTHAIALLRIDTEFESYAPYLRPRNRTVAYALKPVVKVRKTMPVVIPPVENFFKVQEFVPKSVYKKYGDKAIWFIDPRIQKLANFTRKFFGKSVTINNWLWGGNLNERGFREPSSSTGASMSQHKFSRAIDISVSGMTSKQVYDTILANEKAFMEAGLTCLEDITYTPTWCHLDIRNTGLNKILIVVPN